MGGVINVYTLSPFTFEGVRLGMEYGSGNTQKYRISTYYKTSERVGFSVGAYYSKTDGFFKNLYTGEKCDWERSGGGRFKVQYRNLHGLRIDNTFSFVKLEQGGYPYAYVETGQIAYNDPSDYRRTNFNDGLTIRYEGEKFSVASITSYQYLDDRMNLDQDFLPLSYFTLTQARREHAVTEDLVFRSPRRQSLPLAPRCFRLLPPYQHARTGALQGGRHPQPDPRSFRAAGDSRRMGRRYVPARQPLPHARLRSGPLPRIHLRRRPMALHGRPAR